MRVEYEQKTPQDLHLIAPLWDKLREYQRVRSPHFPQHYAARTWKARRAELLKKSRTGGLHLDVATDLDTNMIIGYCVSAISPGGHAVLESIYLSPNTGVTA